jgi:IS4 transposase
MYDWAKFRRTKGGVKLHLLLDHDGYLPKYAVIEPAKKAELKIARKLPLEPGTIVVFDRGYTDYKWFASLTAQGVYFVTRQRWNSYRKVIEQRPIPEKGNILADQLVMLGHRSYRTGVAVRRVVVRDPEKGKQFEFLTNQMDFAASTIAKIYRDRWQIETFFKALKQSLRVKTFVGTSANALKTQIWTALIAMLILKYLKLKSTYDWSLSNLVALLRQQLFVYRDLWTWLNCPFEPPPALAGIHDQLPLALSFS